MYTIAPLKTLVSQLRALKVESATIELPSNLRVVLEKVDSNRWEAAAGNPMTDFWFEADPSKSMILDTADKALDMLERALWDFEDDAPETASGRKLASYECD